jgi:hypothetical protein
MSIRNIFLCTCSLILLSGCAPKEPTAEVFVAQKTASKEMLIYPQNVDFLAQNITPQKVAQDDFTYRYYSPWFRTHVSTKKEDALWANRSYGLKNRYYGENLQLISDAQIDAIINETNAEAYGTLNAHAIMIQNAQMRNLPTEKPFFKKTTLPNLSHSCGRASHYLALQ